ncbi:MAG: aminotransferase class V-fold PLP-dependent enzyme [Chloroflexi bacterium]|nr:aminotransferase class V-fold PLP-dependent enzyme [Chloroflexota bacterium]
MSYHEFIERYPAYSQTYALDVLRDREYARLDRLGHIYLDYTGAGLYAESQVREHLRWLSENVFGNPHSTNPTSLAATEAVERTRSLILDFFHADRREYEVIFTANASGALKLVGESYPFEPGSRYLLTFDNHNSVNGIREFARARGAEVTYIPVNLPEMSLPASLLERELEHRPRGKASLFAYPAQSNFSGVRHSLDWVARAQSLGWDVLLDAAAFVPTAPLDLSQVHPDFVPISFYKMFGYPTGVGALIARKEALRKLRRPWFAGGTITVASVQGDRYYLAEGAAAFEDGTLNFLNIPAVAMGLRHLQSIGYEVIHTRLECLTGWLLENLQALKHPNGQPLVRIYGPTETHGRGATIALNFFDAQGHPIDHRQVERLANQARISLRTGCFCNPGAGELALGLDRLELLTCFSQPGREQRLTLEDFRLCVDGKASGAVRISLGLVSNYEDVQAAIRFAARFVESGVFVSTVGI